MRKSVFWVGLLLILLAGTNVYSRARTGEEMATDDISLLQQALKATGARPVSAEIHGWCQIAPRYYSPREMEKAVKQMAEVFEISPLELSIILRSTGQYGYAIADYPLTADISVRFQVQSVDSTTVAMVELCQSHQRELGYRWQQVHDAIATVNADAGQVKITSCLAGEVSARLRESDKLNLAYAAFNAVQAVYRQGAVAGGSDVWSGFSPLFSDAAETAREKISFSIAIKSNGDTSGSVVRVATPVLPGSY